VIEDPDVDAVAICTRHGSHSALAAAALSAGKHVVLREAPRPRRGRARRRCRRRPPPPVRILAVGFNRRFSPLLRALRTVPRAPDRRPPITYRVAAGSLPADDWQNDLAEGGGRLLGRDVPFRRRRRLSRGRSRRRGSRGRREARREKPIQARDNVVATLRLENGSVASIVYAADVGPGFARNGSTRTRTG
jgi:predicted dehydrogenase